MRTDHDRYKLRSGRHPEYRHIKSGIVGLLVKRTLHQCVWHHTDNRAPWLRLRRIEDPNSFAERALVSIIFPSEARADNRHRLFTVAVINCEVSTFEHFQADRSKVAVG